MVSQSGGDLAAYVGSHADGTLSLETVDMKTLKHRTSLQIDARGALRWSPTGRYLLQDDSRVTGVRVFDMSGTTAVRTPDWAAGIKAEHPRWAPRGDQLAFIGVEGTRSELYIADGRRLEIVKRSSSGRVPSDCFWLGMVPD